MDESTLPTGPEMFAINSAPPSTVSEVVMRQAVVDADVNRGFILTNDDPNHLNRVLTEKYRQLNVDFNENPTLRGQLLANREALLAQGDFVGSMEDEHEMSNYWKDPNRTHLLSCRKKGRLQHKPRNEDAGSDSEMSEGEVSLLVLDSDEDGDE